MKKILFTFLCLLHSAAFSEPLKLVVPYLPGGTGDNTARFIAKSLTDRGIDTIVINKPAGGGTAALIEVVQQADKKTLLLVGPGLVTGKAFEDDKVADALTQTKPILHVSSFSNIIVASKQSGISNWKELQKSLKSKKINVGASSSGSNSFNNYLFRKYPNVAFVSYNGDSKTIVDILSGQIDIANITYPSAVQQISAGNIIPIALTMDHNFDNLPTVKDYQIELAMNAFYGIVGSPSLTKSEQQEYYTIINNVLLTTESKEFFKNIHCILPTSNNPEDFLKFMLNEQKTMRKILKN